MTNAWMRRNTLSSQEQTASPRHALLKLSGGREMIFSLSFDPFQYSKDEHATLLADMFSQVQSCRHFFPRKSVFILQS